MTIPPAWVTALLYWIHMLASLTWIGCIAALSILVLPASRRTLKPVDQLGLIAAVQKRFEPIVWFCIGVLLVTGLFQMSLNVHYNGFLSVSTQWSLAILAKEALAVILAAVTAYHTWELLPKIQRTLMQKDKATEEVLAILNRRELILQRISLVLAGLILLATAIARAS